MKFTNKLIGVVGTVLGDNPRAGVDVRYVNWLSQFGNVVVVDSRQDEIIPQLDLLVLPGGPDVNTYRYGQAPEEACGNFNNQLDRFDTEVLPKYIENLTPIFGICRGLQTLWVHFGGKLHQHVDEPYSVQDTQEVHFVTSPNGGSIYATGSWHHQAADLSTQPKNLEVILMGYGVTNHKPHKIDMDQELCVEGIKHNNLPIAAVQAHPEKSYCADVSNDYVKYCNALLMGLL